MTQTGKIESEQEWKGGDKYVTNYVLSLLDQIEP